MVQGGTVPPLPDATGARLLEALRGGPRAHEAERLVAAGVERRWPGTRAQFRAAAEFHSLIAGWAVAMGGARSLIIAAAGYPPSGWPGASLPHRAAARAVPGSRALYCTGDEALALLWHRVLAPSGMRPPDLGCQAPAADPRQVAGMARAAGLEAPWSVQLQLCAHWWPGPMAAEAVAGYAEVLPAGSTLVITTPVEGGSPSGGEMGRAVAEAAGAMPAGHSAEVVAGWIAGAGMELVWGPGDVRCWPALDRDAEAALAAPLAARVIAAVARGR